MSTTAAASFEVQESQDGIQIGQKLRARSRTPERKSALSPVVGVGSRCVTESPAKIRRQVRQPSDGDGEGGNNNQCEDHMQDDDDERVGGVVDDDDDDEAAVDEDLSPSPTEVATPRDAFGQPVVQPGVGVVTYRVAHVDGRGEEETASRTNNSNSLM